MDSCEADSDPAIWLKDFRAALAKIGGSKDSVIDETRGEWQVREPERSFDSRSL